MKDAAGAGKEGGRQGGGGGETNWGLGEDRRPTERRDKALTLLPGCILAGRQLWIGNITAAGN